MSFGEKMYASTQDRIRDLVQQPDWYKEFGRSKKIRLLGAAGLQAAFNGNIIQAVAGVKEEFYNIFEQLLQEDVVTLGTPSQELEDWDEERQAVSKVVVHHTSRPPGLSLEKLNAIHLLRLYVPRYQSKSSPVVDDVGNPQPIYSGHVNDEGKQVFYGYHWLVREDGTTERLLQDTATGWHADNWKVNCESVGICVDDDLSSKEPSMVVIRAIAGIIRRHYSDITPDENMIIGHNEVTQTVCPGEEFLRNWKQTLVSQLKSA
jgi:hypothetical protein